MSPLRLYLVVLLAAAAALSAGLAQAAETFTARVTDVVAGDLIKVDRDGAPIEVRLYGVDCPETGQPAAAKARDYVKRLVGGKNVSIEELTKDSLGKTVATVRQGGEETEDAVSLNHALTKAGLAWWDKANAPEERSAKRLTVEAIKAKRGLWSEGVPLAPWDYRRSHNLPLYTYRITEKAETPEPPAPRESEEKKLSMKGNAVPGGGGRVVDISNVDFSKDVDVNSLLTKHMPTIAKDDGGNPIGLAVPNISEIPYAPQLGFQNGDILSSVNGQRITDFSQGYALYNKFKNTNVSSVDVEVVRGGQPVNWTIPIPR